MEPGKAIKWFFEALTRSGTRILGAVLNNMRAGADGGLYYTSYYGRREGKDADPVQPQGTTYGS